MSQLTKPSNTKRAFLALTLSEASHQRLITIQKQLPTRGLRLTPRGNFHITLAFLGETPVAALALLCKQLAKWPIPTLPQFTLLQCAPFPSKRSPLIAAEITPNTALTTLYTELLYLLKQLKIASAPKPFRPHITLGRYKHLPDKIPELRLCGNAVEYIQATALTLYHSQLTPQGSRFEVICARELPPT